MFNFSAKSIFATIASLFQKTKIENINVVKTATIAHFDIRNYQLLSMMYQTEPEVPIKLMANFIHHVASFVVAFNGILMNKQEEGATAGWNAPIDELDHVKQAVLSSLALINKLHDINVELKHDNLPTINAGIGISTGDIEIASKNANYICSGNVFNLSKFLSSKSTAYKMSIIIHEEMYDILNKDFITIELDRVYYNDDSITLYTIIGTTQFIPISHQTISYNHHNKFLRAYRDQKWDIAISIANGLKNAWNNKLKDYYLIMIENCKHLKENPPNEHWIELHK